MSVYHYIAHKNTEKANNLCMRKGLPDSYDDKNQLADYLQAIVSDDGENGLKEVLGIHPDKEVIIALFAPIEEEVVVLKEPQQEQYSQRQEEQHKDKQKEFNGSFERVEIPLTISSKPAMLNATGSSQTNTYILIAALVVSVAILSMK